MTRRRHRPPRRRTMLALGIAALALAGALALAAALSRAGLFERWLGWSALRSIGRRTLDALAAAPALAALAAAGGTLIAAAILSRK